MYFRGNFEKRLIWFLLQKKIVKINWEKYGVHSKNPWKSKIIRKSAALFFRCLRTFLVIRTGPVELGGKGGTQRQVFREHGHIFFYSFFYLFLQVNLCQKHLLLHQLTHNMTKDCLLQLQGKCIKIASSEHVVGINCSECQNKKQFLYTPRSPYVLSLQFSCYEQSVVIL